ncbi:hypothetical protein CSUI_003810, partial [Cystoisospora suis]
SVCLSAVFRIFSLQTIEAWRPSTSSPFKTLVSSLTVIEEPRAANTDRGDDETPPFPLLETYPLQPALVPPYRPILFRRFFSSRKR